MIFTFYAFLSFCVNVGFCIFYSFVYCFKKHIPKTKSSVHGSCCLNYKIKVLCSFSGISDKPQFLADVVGSSDRVESPPRPFSQSIMSRNPFPSQVNSFFLLVFPIIIVILTRVHVFNVFHFTWTQLAIFNLRLNSNYLGRNIRGQNNEREPSPETHGYWTGSRGIWMPCLLLINQSNVGNLNCKCFALQRFYWVFEEGLFKGLIMQCLAT